MYDEWKLENVTRAKPGKYRASTADVGAIRMIGAHPRPQYLIAYQQAFEAHGDFDTPEEAAERVRRVCASRDNFLVRAQLVGAVANDRNRTVYEYDNPAKRGRWKVRKTQRSRRSATSSL